MPPLSPLPVTITPLLHVSTLYVVIDAADTAIALSAAILRQRRRHAAAFDDY